MASVALAPATKDIAEGTLVIRIDDFERPHLTRTRSVTWIASGHPVVKVEGVTGCYLLERIFVMPERA